ncbi:MAG: MarR family winged helix-turn-helix transcriptional regulator [Rhodospirillales bacterium]
MPDAEICNCLAVRQAARHVSQYYDRHLAPAGLRTSQYSILAKLNRLGPLTINALAAELVTDRTTLGRNVQPLQREGLVAVAPGREDRRNRELRLTDAGIARLRSAAVRWKAAQEGFESAFGRRRARELRALMRAVTTTEPGE